MEFAYNSIVRAAGISMSECRIHCKGGRSHFMTKRFDRGDTSRKIHMQSLVAIRHFNFNDLTDVVPRTISLTVADW